MSATAIYDEVTERMGFAIVSGALPAGSRLTLSEIEERHQVSRTVARDVAKTLSSLGLLESRRKAGLEVRPRTEWRVLTSQVIAWRLASEDRLEQISSLTDVREAIEPTAARLAAARPNEAHARELVRLGGKLMSLAERGLGRSPEYLSTDIEFHSLLLEASGNEMLFAMRGMVADVLRGRAVHDLHPIWPDLEAVKDHLLVAEAILAGNPEAAEAASRRQLRLVHLEIDKAETPQG